MLNEKDTVTVQVIAERIDNLNDHISDLRDSMHDGMQKMTNAVDMMQAHERLALQLDKYENRCRELELRVDNLEKEQPMTQQVTKWVMRAVWSVAAGAAAFVAKTLGFF